MPNDTQQIEIITGRERRRLFVVTYEFVWFQDIWLPFLHRGRQHAGKYILWSGTRDFIIHHRDSLDVIRQQGESTVRIAGGQSGVSFFHDPKT